MQLPAGPTRELVSKWCLSIQQANAQMRGKAGLLGPRRGYRFDPAWNSADWLGLLWHERVELMLATEQFANQLRSPEYDDDLEFCFPQTVDFRRFARLIRDDEAVMARLTTIMGDRRRKLHPTAASLLHAADIGWHPEPSSTSGWRILLARKKFAGACLYGANLRKAKWPGIVLSRVELSHADLAAPI